MNHDTESLVQQLRIVDGVLPTTEIASRLRLLDDIIATAEHYRFLTCAFGALAITACGVLGTVLAYTAVTKIDADQCISQAAADELLDIATRISDTNQRCIAMHQNDRATFDVLMARGSGSGSEPETCTP